MRFRCSIFFIALCFFVYPVFAEDNLSTGERFHKETAMTWTGALGDLFRSKPKRPPQYKTYPKSMKIKLPTPKAKGMNLGETLHKRRSVREYSKKNITLNQLSQLVFAAQGVTGKVYNHLLRTAPSAGALYPCELYVVVNRVDGVEPGLYHYAVQDHALEQVKKGDLRSALTSAGLKQDMLSDSSVTFIITVIIDRLRHKYGERSFRYAYMEAGHISQNIYLQATSMDLGSVAVGAFIDEEANELVGVDGKKEAVVYMHALGTL